jgi:ketosteroid isomerase-like protein
MGRLFLECAVRAALLVGATAIVLYTMRVKAATARQQRLEWRRGGDAPAPDLDGVGTQGAAAHAAALGSEQCKALDRMTADDYTFITLRGDLRTKSEIVKGFQSGSFKYESHQISDLNTRVYGNTVVVTGRSNQKGMENGKDYSGDDQFTRVYVRQKGRWLTVALQATVIKP